MSELGPYLHRKVVVLHPEATLEQAAKAMDEHGFGCIFVADQGHLIGVLTDRDVVCRGVAHSHPPTHMISAIMTPDPVSVDEDAKLAEVIRVMEDRGIRRIPVVKTTSSGRQRCVGLVNLDDLLASRAIDDYQAMRVVRGQIRRRILGSGDFRSWLVIHEPGQEREPGGHSTGLSSELYRAIALATDLKYEKAMKLVASIASALIHRLNHMAAVQLIVTMPAELQSELNEVPHGPDRTIHTRDLIREVIEDLGVSQMEAQSYISRASRALEEWVGFSRFAHIKSQLPDEMKKLFSKQESSDLKQAS